MQISSSDLQLSMRHTESASLRVQTRAVVQRAPGPPVGRADDRPLPRPAQPARDSVQWSTQAPRAEMLPSDRARCCDDVAVDEPAAGTHARDPMLRMLAQMIEWITGRPVKCFDGACLQPQAQRDASASASPGALGLASPAMPSAAVAMNAAASQTRGEASGIRAIYRESEQLDFLAKGSVNTADGRTIQFSIHLQMQRSYGATIDLQPVAAAPAPTDPLVINFDGTAAQLSDQRFAFDLDQDGKTDAMRLPARGSALLVFDRNANGRLDDASELFGPGSGDGFAELQVLDDDGNGWIDGGDASFTRLGVMRADDAADAAVRPLAIEGVGALSTGRIDTPFSLKDRDNAWLGQVRATGLYVTEQGRVGTVQQLDVVV